MHVSVVSACFNADENETSALVEFYSVLAISRAIGEEVNRFKRSGSNFNRVRRRMRYERRHLLERTIREHFPNVCVVNQLGCICLHKDRVDAEKHHREFQIVDSLRVFNVNDLESVIERNGGSIVEIALEQVITFILLLFLRMLSNQTACCNHTYFIRN